MVLNTLKDISFNSMSVLVSRPSDLLVPVHAASLGDLEVVLGGVTRLQALPLLHGKQSTLKQRCRIQLF